MSSDATFTEGVLQAIGSLRTLLDDPTGDVYARVRYGPIGVTAADAMTAEQRACPLAVAAGTAVHKATAEGYVEVVNEWHCLARALLRMLTEATGLTYVELLEELSRDLGPTTTPEPRDV